MPSEEWIKTLADGRRVKFTYQDVSAQMEFITAQIECHEVVYSILSKKAKDPLCREDIESRFKNELSIKPNI
jgi:hypothetical protein